MSEKSKWLNKLAFYDRVLLFLVSFVFGVSATTQLKVLIESKSENIPATFLLLLISAAVMVLHWYSMSKRRG